MPVWPKSKFHIHTNRYPLHAQVKQSAVPVGRWHSMLAQPVTNHVHYPFGQCMVLNCTKCTCCQSKSRSTTFTNLEFTRSLQCLKKFTDSIGCWLAHALFGHQLTKFGFCLLWYAHGLEACLLGCWLYKQNLIFFMCLQHWSDRFGTGPSAFVLIEAQ